MQDTVYASIADPETDTTAPHELLFDFRLKDGSVRLLLLILALLKNPGWTLTMSGVATIMHRTRRQVERYIADLRTAGYLRSQKHWDESTGRWNGWSWTIYRRGLAVHTRTNELPIWRSAIR